MNESENKYYVNGKVFKCNLKEPILLYLIQSFLNNNDSSEFNIAVAVNDVLIEKYRWKKKKICVDDKIEIVAPFFGG